MVQIIKILITKYKTILAMIKTMKDFLKLLTQVVALI